MPRHQRIAEIPDTVASPDNSRDLDALTARLVLEVGGTGADGRFNRAQLLDAIGRAWSMGAEVAISSAMGVRICRICGCSQLQACTERCAWVADDLCSTCAPQGGVGAAARADPIRCGRCARPAARVHICEAC